MSNILEKISLNVCADYINSLLDEYFKNPEISETDVFITDESNKGEADKEASRLFNARISKDNITGSLRELAPKLLQEVPGRLTFSSHAILGSEEIGKDYIFKLNVPAEEIHSVLYSLYKSCIKRDIPFAMSIPLPKEIGEGFVDAIEIYSDEANFENTYNMIRSLSNLQANKCKTPSIQYCRLDDHIGLDMVDGDSLLSEKAKSVSFEAFRNLTPEEKELIINNPKIIDKFVGFVYTIYRDANLNHVVIGDVTPEPVVKDTLVEETIVEPVQEVEEVSAPVMEETSVVEEVSTPVFEEETPVEQVEEGTLETVSEPVDDPTLEETQEAVSFDVDEPIQNVQDETELVVSEEGIEVDLPAPEVEMALEEVATEEIPTNDLSENVDYETAYGDDLVADDVELADDIDVAAMDGVLQYVDNGQPLTEEDFERTVSIPTVEDYSLDTEAHNEGESFDFDGVSIFNEGSVGTADDVVTEPEVTEGLETVQVEETNESAPLDEEAKEEKLGLTAKIKDLSREISEMFADLKISPKDEEVVEQTDEDIIEAVETQNIELSTEDNEKLFDDSVVSEETPIEEVSQTSSLLDESNVRDAISFDPTIIMAPVNPDDYETEVVEETVAPEVEDSKVAAEEKKEEDVVPEAEAPVEQESVSEEETSMEYTTYKTEVFDPFKIEDAQTEEALNDLLVKGETHPIRVVSAEDIDVVGEQSDEVSPTNIQVVDDLETPEQPNEIDMMNQLADQDHYDESMYPAGFEEMSSEEDVVASSIDIPASEEVSFAEEGEPAIPAEYASTEVEDLTQSEAEELFNNALDKHDEQKQQLIEKYADISADSRFFDVVLGLPTGETVTVLDYLEENNVIERIPLDSEVITADGEKLTGAEFVRMIFPDYVNRYSSLDEIIETFTTKITPKVEAKKKKSLFGLFGKKTA